MFNFGITDRRIKILEAQFAEFETNTLKHLETQLLFIRQNTAACEGLRNQIKTLQDELAAMKKAKRVSVKKEKK